MRGYAIVIAILLVSGCSPVRVIEVKKKVNGKAVVVEKIVLGPENRPGGVFFRVKPPAGTYRVAVAGDFNQWDPDSWQLTNTGRFGVWSGFIPIRDKNLRKIEFKYIVNGNSWMADPHTAHTADGYGSSNSVFVLQP